MALSLARMGARVVIASSDTFACMGAVREIKELSGNQNVDFYRVDLSDMSSVRHAATQINQRESHLHILINNAGMIRVCDFDKLDTSLIKLPYGLYL